MNTPTVWRRDFGAQVAASYAVHPKVEVVALGGSVARGWADEHSDIELFVFWNSPPTKDDRIRVITSAGGRVDIFWRNPPTQAKYREVTERTDGQLGMLWPYEDDEWSEHFYVSGVNIGVSGFLCDTVERYLEDVSKNNDTSDRKHILLSAIVHGLPVYGKAQFEDWRSRASAYTDQLAHAVITGLIDIDQDWWDCEKLAERDDRFALQQLFAQMVQKILRMLLALNRIYLDNPKFKWLDRLTEEMKLQPRDLSSRLKFIFTAERISGVAEVQRLFEDTLDLIEDDLPGIDTTYARKWYRHRRVKWEHSPHNKE